MSSLFTHFDVHPWELFVRTITIYFVVVVFLRLAGKKQFGQMGPTEFVAVLLLSNAVQNAMVGADNSLLGGVVCAGALVLTSRFVSWATFKSGRTRALLEGTPNQCLACGNKSRRPFRIANAAAASEGSRPKACSSDRQTRCSAASKKPDVPELYRS